MKSSLDLYTEHIWHFLHSYKEFNYEDITCLPPDTILQFSEDKDRGYGRISSHKSIESYDYCLMDVVWNNTTWISKSGGAIDPFCIDSKNIVQVCGDLSLKWKKISDTLKKAKEEMKQIFMPLDELVEYKNEFLSNIAKESLVSSIEDYLSTIRENLYLRLILSHRNDPPRPYP